MKKLLVLIICLGIALTAFSGCAKPTPVAEQEVPLQGTSTTTQDFAKSVDWAAEYDVVVVGYGIAGTAAAVSASDAGASVLLLEKAPKGKEGGNSRICSQGIAAAVEEDRENVLTYMRSLRADFQTPSDDLLETFVDGMIQLPDWFENKLGTDDFTLSVTQEFPELEGSGYQVLRVSGESNTGKAYELMQGNVKKRPIDVWYEAPALHLIQDQDTGIIHGVIANVDGQNVNIRAKNGVILACGGYENNDQMVEDYVGRAGLVALGNISYNTGDGILMAQEVGANIWHMGNNVIADFNFYNQTTQNCTFKTQPMISKLGCIMVGGDGTRFMAESSKPRHGKIYFHGSFISAPYPDDIYVVLDESIRLSGKLDQTFSENNEEEIANGWLIKADTLEELAEKLDVPAEKLVATVKQYNGFVDAGEDMVFGRDPKTMVSRIENGPFYAIAMVPAICNTQGGPQRNENAEILALDGSVIPHLYGAGELGDIWSYCYNAYSNLGSGLVFGRIAGENAAQAKIDVSQESMMGDKENYQPAAKEVSYEVGENQYIGKARGKSDMTVRVTVEDGVITAVEVVENNETAGICDRAIATIPEEIVAANSTQVDAVAGATLTSKGIMAAVEDALTQTKK